jgi:hypothetical protein
MGDGGLLPREKEISVISKKYRLQKKQAVFFVSSFSF